TRGYDIIISWPSVLIALVGTLAWVALVRWRLHNKPAALWRGAVLAAGGLITTWRLLVTLWMPVLDYGRSYRVVSAQLATALRDHSRPGECVRALAVGTGQRASFLVFEDSDFSYASACTLILQQTSQQAVREGYAAYSDSATVLWQGRRGADRDELFRLLRVSR